MEAIILLGGPGAGKGTLAGTIKANSDYIHVSTGDMLRTAVKSGCELGLKAQAFMDSGNLVPDELVLGMIRKRVTGDASSARFMFDGFPRTLEQARGLRELCDDVGGGITTVLATIVIFAVFIVLVVISDIIHIQEAGSFKAQVHKSGLHSR
jgi:adenylate kinase family enzyme